jgi:hypothetical protein
VSCSTQKETRTSGRSLSADTSTGEEFGAIDKCQVHNDIVHKELKVALLQGNPNTISPDGSKASHTSMTYSGKERTGCKSFLS